MQEKLSRFEMAVGGHIGGRLRPGIADFTQSIRRTKVDYTPRLITAAGGRTLPTDLVPDQ